MIAENFMPVTARIEKNKYQFDGEDKPQDVNQDQEINYKTLRLSILSWSICFTSS